MAYQTGGNNTTNLLYGLGGRVLGGVAGYLVGGPAGISTGWSLGGSVGDALQKPLEYSVSQRDVTPIDVNQQYQYKKLRNRENNFRNVTNEDAGWAPKVLAATDLAVNVTGGIMDYSASKNPNSKFGQFWGSDSPLFGNGKKKTSDALSIGNGTPQSETGKVSSEGLSFSNFDNSQQGNTGTDVGGLFNINKSINDMTKSINKNWLKSTKKSGGIGSMPARIEDFDPTSSIFGNQQSPFLNQNFQFNPYT